MNNTKERPIALTAQEVNAVLAGNKTQHRVPVDIDHSVALTYHSLEAGGAVPERLDALPFDCPLGEIGDRLWVQELHARTEHQDYLTRTHYYAGNGDLRPDLRHDAGLLTKYDADDMPRWASRLLLEITDIRIERVQDISGDDACAEGCPKFLTRHCFEASKPYADRNAISWFAGVWKEKYGESSYLDNPWVWVIEFKVVEPSEVQGG